MNRSSLVLALVAVLALVSGVASQPAKKFRLTTSSQYPCKLTINVAFTTQASKTFEIMKGSRTINTDVPIGDATKNMVKDISVVAPDGCIKLNGNEWNAPDNAMPLPNANVQVSADGSTNIAVTA